MADCILLDENDSVAILRKQAAQGSDRCCQTNANQSPFSKPSYLLCCAQFAPLGESGVAVQLEIGPAVEVTFLIEMIVDRGVDGREFLQT